MPRGFVIASKRNADNRFPISSAKHEPIDMMASSYVYERACCEALTGVNHMQRRYGQDPIYQIGMPIFALFTVRMSFWNRIFNRSEEGVYPGPDLFGRFSDVHKTPDRYARFDASRAAFEQGNYRQALIDFLEYIRNPQANNVTYDPAARVLTFEIVQGSRLIKGVLEHDRVIVRSQIVDGTQFTTGLLRRFLEKNYSLNYSRFCLDEHKQLHVIFESFVQDANPYKLYYGIKELALKADKNDDLILDEFHQFDVLDEDKQTPLFEKVLDIKTSFFYTTLSSVKNSLDNGVLRKSHDANSVIYAILGTLYKIDILLTPNGRSTDIIETAHRQYFADTTRPVERRMSALVGALEALFSKEKDDIRKEWYDVVYTFGLNPSISLPQAKDFIQTEIGRVQWHIENFEPQKAHFIIQFTISYILFNYSVDRLLFGLLLFYYRVTDQSFFTAMGCRGQFINEKGGLNRRQIVHELKQVVDLYEEEYYNVAIPYQAINTDSVVTFGLSLLQLILASSFTALESNR